MELVLVMPDLQKTRLRAVVAKIEGQIIAGDEIAIDWDDLFELFGSETRKDLEFGKVKMRRRLQRVEGKPFAGSWRLLAAESQSESPKAFRKNQPKACFGRGESRRAFARRRDKSHAKPLRKKEIKDEKARRRSEGARASDILRNDAARRKVWSVEKKKRTSGAGERARPLALGRRQDTKRGENGAGQKGSKGAGHGEAANPA
jgi:hypothetical protein